MHPLFIPLIVSTASSSIVSFLCSATIVFMLSRGGGARLKKIHNRLLLCMSISDILQSIAMALSTTAIPAGSLSTSTSTVPGAIGNRATCSIQGFFIQLGFVTPNYNAMLCLYYMLIIKYNIRDSIIKKYERYMHAFAILPPLLTAIVAASNNLFNQNQAVCWLAAENQDDAGHSSLLLLSLNGTVLAFIILDFVAISCTMLLVIMTVRDREQKMTTYQFRRTQSTKRSRRRSNLSNTTVDTKIQALIYVTGFLFTNIFLVTNVIITSCVGTVPPVPLLLLQGIFFPSQGLWNFVAYIRPRYDMVSEFNLEKNMIQKLFIAILMKPDAMSSPTKRSRPKRSGTLMKSNRATNKSLHSPSYFNRENPTSQPTNEVPSLAQVNVPHSPLADEERGMITTETVDNKSSSDPSEPERLFYQSLGFLVAQDLIPARRKKYRRRSMCDEVSYPLEKLDFADIPFLKDLKTPVEEIDDRSSDVKEKNVAPCSLLPDTSTFPGTQRGRPRRSSCPSLQSSIGPFSSEREAR